MDDALFCLLMIAWRIHGMVVLELNHHLQPTIGDAEALYRFEVDVHLLHNCAPEFRGDFYEQTKQ